MASNPDRKSRRPFAPKVKTGCLRCKTRKVKCPEEKPQCSRCVRMGLTDCQYPLLSQPRNLPPPSTTQTARSLPPLAMYALARAPSSLLFGSAISTLGPEEVTYLDRFRHKMILRITSLTFNDFWDRVILQETLGDECVLDAVLSLGALDQAWDQANAMQRCLSPDRSSVGNTLETSSSMCYRQAIQYYSRSVNKLRLRMRTVNEQRATSVMVADLQKLVPVLTMLYSLFEWLHGDDRAHDRLLFNGLSMVKDKAAVVPRGTPPNETANCNTRQARPGAQRSDINADFMLYTEDAGSLIVRWILLSWLQWPGTSSSAAAVVHYYTWHPGSGSMLSDATCPPAPPACVASSNYDVVCMMVLKMVTLVILWFTRLRIDGIDEATMAAVAGEEGPELNRLRDEQCSLEAWVKAWEEVLADKTAAETDAIGKLILTEFLFGCKTLTFIIQMAVPGPTARDDGMTAESIRTAHSIMDEVEMRVRTKSAMGEVGLGECNPTALALVCRECRDMGVRARALTTCRWGAQANSLWDEKGSMIGTCALAGLEEKSRDVSSGRIPREAQWRWVHAEWAPGHDFLHVTFKSAVRDEAGQFRYKKARLSAQEFGFAGLKEQ